MGKYKRDLAFFSVKFQGQEALTCTPSELLDKIREKLLDEKKMQKDKEILEDIDRYLFGIDELQKKHRFYGPKSALVGYITHIEFKPKEDVLIYRRIQVDENETLEEKIRSVGVNKCISISKEGPYINITLSLIPIEEWYLDCKLEYIEKSDILRMRVRTKKVIGPLSIQEDSVKNLEKLISSMNENSLRNFLKEQVYSGEIDLNSYINKKRKISFPLDALIFENSPPSGLIISGPKKIMIDGHFDGLIENASIVMIKGNFEGLIKNVDEVIIGGWAGGSVENCRKLVLVHHPEFIPISPHEFEKRWKKLEKKSRFLVNMLRRMRTNHLR